MSKLSILIVEDEAIVAADLAGKVRQLGYDVAGMTASGAEAVELACRLHPALVLMDIHLAGAMDGIAAAREINHLCNLPVLFLTAHSDIGTVERAQQAEVFGYLLKPFDDRDLRIQIEMALYKYASERRLHESQERLAAINQILQAALSSETEKELGLVCLKVAEKITHSRFGFIGDFTEAGFEDIAISDPAWEVCTISGNIGHCSQSGNFKIQGVYGRVIKDGKGLFTNDPAHHPDYNGLPEDHPPLTAFLGVPLLRDGLVIGILAVGNREGGYTQSDQDALETLTPSVVEAFMRKRAEEKARKTAADLNVANTKLRDSRRAALNLMQDAIISRRQAEGVTSQLLRSENRLQLFIECAPAALAMFDRNMCYLYVSRRWRSDYGLDDRDLRGVSHYEVFPEISDRWKEYHRLGLTGEVLVDEADRFERSDGSLQWIRWEIRPWYDEEGNVGGILIFAEEITSRMESEQAILRAKLEWERTFDSVPDLIALIDTQHRITRVNKTMAQHLGVTVEQCIGQSCFFIFHGTDCPPSFCPHALTMSDAQTHEAELYEDLLGGTFQVTTTALLDEWGTMIGSIHVARDISERKWAEERLLKAHNELELRVIERTSELAGTVTALQGEIDERKKTEAALEKSSREIEDLYNLAPCGYHSLNRDGTFIRINDTELKWLGYSRDEVIGKLKVSDIMPPESLVVLAENFPRFISGDEVTDMRFNFFRKDGSILPVLLNASPIMNEQGDYLMSRSTIYDITDLIQAEESIRRLNQLYLTLSETGKAIAHIPDRDGLFHEICRIAVEHGGFRMAWIGLVDEESGIVRPAAAFGSGMDYLENIRISARLEPEGMGPTGTAIRQNSHYICNDFRSDPCITPWVEKAESHGFHASAALAIKLNGSAIGALTLYSAVQEFFDDQLVELLVKMQEDISFALDNLDREARRRKIEYSLQKEITGRLQANEALREKEQMLLHQSRLAAMGEMINNIAHQWRQPLNTLGLIIQKMTLFYDTPEFNREFLEKNTSNAMEIIQHMSGTINDFRNFFRSDKEQETFAIDQVIRQTLKFIDQTLKDMNIEIVTHCEGAPMGSGYPNEFGHAILNILTNARDAFVEHKMEDARISLNAFVEVDTSVVTITDNAGGISEEIIDRLFDPYFSTKGPDKGTGLGLFIAKNIIENNMAGRLSVRNTGNGAEFRIEVKNGDN